MQIHFFDPHTGAYASSQLAMTDPMNGDAWLMPAFTTDKALPDRPFRTWPFFVNGEWVLREDWRGVVLYSRETGAPGEVYSAGVTLDQAGVTLDPRPSEDHTWNPEAAAWAVSPETLAARERREAQARLDAEILLARERLHGKDHAYVAGLLTPLEAGMFKAWAAYALSLSHVQSNPEFPNVKEWPTPPRDEDVIAQVKVEQEEAERRAAEQAAVLAEQEAARKPWRGEEPPERYRGKADSAAADDEPAK